LTALNTLRTLVANGLSENEEIIDIATDYFKIYSMGDAKNFAKAGKLKHMVYLIEKRLRKKVDEFQANPQQKFKLPHHTLIAKDKDVSQPEIRLFYKLSCHMAAGMTSDVLHHYYSGGSYSDLKSILDIHYRHPIHFLNNNLITKNKLSQIVNDLYGKRWWLYADDSQNEVITS